MQYRYVFEMTIYVHQEGVHQNFQIYYHRQLQMILHQLMPLNLSDYLGEMREKEEMHYHQLSVMHKKVYFVTVNDLQQALK